MSQVTPLASYLRAVRSHPLILLVVIAATVGISGALLLTKAPRFEATARILVTPLPSGDRSLIGLPLPRAVGEPARAVETAARLIEGAASARLRADDYDPPGGVEFSLSMVDVDSQEGSNIVEVQATASNAERAAEIANAYATAAISERERQLRTLAREALAATRSELATTSDPSRREILENRLADLALLSEGTDPTLSVAQEAVAPRSRAGTPRFVILAVAFAAGFALGSVASLLVELLVRRRLRDEFDVVRAYPLPILARVSAIPSSSRAGDAPADEGYRRLRTQLMMRAFPGSSDVPEPATRNLSVGIATGAGIELGNTVVAGLARAIVEAGETVLVVDLDPSGRSQLPEIDQDATLDLYTALGQPGDLARAVRSRVTNSGIAMIRATAGPEGGFDEQTFLAARDVLEAARTAAQWTLVLLPPANEHGESVIVAGACDHVVVVTRPGESMAPSLVGLRELFETAGRVPTGHVLIGLSRRRQRASARGGRSAAAA